MKHPPLHTEAMISTEYWL